MWKEIKKGMQKQNNWNKEFEQNFNTRIERIEKSLQQANLANKQGHDTTHRRLSIIFNSINSLPEKLLEIQQSVLTNKLLDEELEIYIPTKAILGEDKDEKIFDLETLNKLILKPKIKKKK